MNKLTKRIPMCILGVTICGVSVGMFKHAALGVDPFQSMMSGLDALSPIRFGTLYVIANLLLLSFALIFDRRKIGLGTFINLFLLGYITEFSQRLCARLMPELSIAGRFALFLAALVIVSLSSALYFTADLGVSTYDAIALVWSQRQKRLPFQVCRMITDCVCVLLGVSMCLLAGMSVRQILGVVNVGTLVTAFFMGPLIAFFNRRVAQPLLGK